MIAAAGWSAAGPRSTFQRASAPPTGSRGVLTAGTTTWAPRGPHAQSFHFGGRVDWSGQAGHSTKPAHRVASDRRPIGLAGDTRRS